ncbi:MAG TPA: UDP-N-acetylmuramate dehydrogenase [Methylomirabilota bacterium]|nr:UDP-N-acetylmuramate dehydrogenase [Methylomirabilota bacterium]
MSRLSVQERVPLAALTTLGVGGPARWLVEAADEASVIDAHAWARARGIALRILGGGSNVVVADRGVDALVVRLGLRGVQARPTRDGVEVTAAAGEPWDAFVAGTVEHEWAGLECLSGIPGLVGATPIQNVGAYGQEVSDTVIAVRALDTKRGEVATVPASECGFAYRDSAFKQDVPGRWVVLAVTYRLHPGAAPTLGYADVARHLAEQGVATPSLRDVRQAVLTIRRGKSMVLDQPDDPNRRSCGSFFLNPILEASAVATVLARAGDPAMPRWLQADGRVKLSAAWLIERAGFTRGVRRGPVGLSTKHTLAIVAHDDARAADVLAFARHIQDGVFARFGVPLTPEPVLWGAG